MGCCNWALCVIWLELRHVNILQVTGLTSICNYTNVIVIVFCYLISPSMIYQNCCSAKKWTIEITINDAKIFYAVLIRDRHGHECSRIWKLFANFTLIQCIKIVSTYIGHDFFRVESSLIQSNSRSLRDLKSYFRTEFFFLLVCQKNI